MPKPVVNILQVLICNFKPCNKPIIILILLMRKSKFAESEIAQDHTAKR